MKAIGRGASVLYVVLSLAIVVFQAARNSNYQKSIASLQLTSERLAEQIRKSKYNSVRKVSEEGTTQSQSAFAVRQRATLEAWISSAERLKLLLEASPEKKIPELSLLTDGDYLAVARNANLDTDSDARAAYSALRSLAKKRFTPLIQNALKQYIGANNGQLPATVADLATYFSEPIDPQILTRYQMTQSGTASGSSGNEVSEIAPVDEEHDTLFQFTTYSRGIQDVNSFTTSLNQALSAYSAVNGGQQPKDQRDLLPFLSPDKASELIQKLDSGK